MIDQTLQWVADTGAPNGLVLLAVLTRPATWTRWAIQQVEERLPSTGEGDSSSK